MSKEQMNNIMLTAVTSFKSQRHHKHPIQIADLQPLCLNHKGEDAMCILPALQYTWKGTYWPCLTKTTSPLSLTSPKANTCFAGIFPRCCAAKSRRSFWLSSDTSIPYKCKIEKDTVNFKTTIAKVHLGRHCNQDDNQIWFDTMKLFTMPKSIGISYLFQWIPIIGICECTFICYHCF